MDLNYSTFVTLFPFVMLLVWWAPLLFLAMSRRGTGQERATRAVACVFASWLGYLCFILSTRRTEVANG